MDPLSQAALGAACAQPAARRAQLGAASLCGVVAGMAPDLDVLIRSRTDPLLALEYHRHFTHSLAFVPLGALICAALLFPLCRRRLSFAACYAFACLGFASHGLLDACTSYGTLLFWPFSGERVALDIVSVVDPLFTLPMIVLVILGVLRRRRVFAVAGLAWGLAYLGLGAIQHERAEAAATRLAAARGHSPAQVTVKPSFGNILLWKTIYEAGGHFHIDAVRVVVGASVFPGESRARLDPATHLPWLAAGSQQQLDLERFAWFAAGYLALDRDNRNLIVDLRYSLVPNRGDGLWGIEIDPTAGPEAHAAYVTMRARSAAEGRELLGMLLQGGQRP